MGSILPLSRSPTLQPAGRQHSGMMKIEHKYIWFCEHQLDSNHLGSLSTYNWLTVLLNNGSTGDRRLSETVNKSKSADYYSLVSPSSVSPLQRPTPNPWSSSPSAPANSPPPSLLRCLLSLLQLKPRGHHDPYNGSLVAFTLDFHNDCCRAWGYSDRLVILPDKTASTTWAIFNKKRLVWLL